MRLKRLVGRFAEEDTCLISTVTWERVDWEVNDAIVARKEIQIQTTWLKIALERRNFQD